MKWIVTVLRMEEGTHRRSQRGLLAIAGWMERPILPYRMFEDQCLQDVPLYMRRQNFGSMAKFYLETPSNLGRQAGR